MASPSTTARSRTQKLDSDDALAMRAAELAAWAQRNVRTVVTVTAVVLLVALALVFIRLTNARKAERAAAEWLVVQPSTVQGMTGVQRLTSFASTFAGTPEAAEARLAAADIYLDNDQPQQAIEQARRVVEAGGLWTYKGLMMLGAAQARADQRAEAIQTYQRAAEEAEMTFERLEARSEAALLHEQAGEWAEAARIYGTMLADTEEGSLDRAIMELRKAEAESRARAAS